jgi:RNA polymerase sigma-B factor
MLSRATCPRWSPDERDQRTTVLFERLFATNDAAEREDIVEQIVILYLDLCSTMAGRYDGRGVEHDDLVQVARLALVKAVHGFEPGRGRCFAAYAVPTISGELKRWFRDHGWMVRPPRRLQELRARLRAVRADLEQQLGATPSEDELASAVGASVEELREIAQATTAFRPLSIDGATGDDDHSSLATILSRPDGELERAEDRACLAGPLSQLDDDDRELLLLRFVDGLTQREIGELRGVSQMHVSRCLRRIVGRLQEQLVDGPHSGTSAELSSAS